MSDEAVILLAEDREDDILLIRRAFRLAFLNNPLQVVRDGEECIGYLSGIGKFSNRAEYPLPDLLLLDLKMPKMDGFEVLLWLRRQPTLCSLRVIVVTSSEAMRDVNRAYHLGANSFLVKPSDFENYIGMSKFLADFLRISKVPEISRPAKISSPPAPRSRSGS